MKKNRCLTETTSSVLCQRQWEEGNKYYDSLEYKLESGKRIGNFSNNDEGEIQQKIEKNHIEKHVSKVSTSTKKNFHRFNHSGCVIEWRTIVLDINWRRQTF